MRQLTGYLLASLGMLFSELGHQLVHGAEWCLDHPDGRKDCPNCIHEPGDPPDAYV